MTFSNSILAGETLVRTAMQSENFNAGVDGWRIERDGDAEFNDVVIRGAVDVASTEAHVIIDSSAWDTDGLPAVQYTFPSSANWHSDYPASVTADVVFEGMTNERGAILMIAPAIVKADSTTSVYARIGAYSEPIDLPGQMARVAIEGVNPNTLQGNAPVIGSINTDPIVTQPTVAIDRVASGNIGATETVVHSLTFTTVLGAEYMLDFTGRLAQPSSGTVPTAGDRFVYRIRETDASGTILQEERYFWQGAGIVQSPSYLRTWYKETNAPQSRTFVVTLLRESGSGVARSWASNERPAIFEAKRVGPRN